MISPSQVETYLTCPMLHHLTSTEKWAPCQVGDGDVAALMGRAMALGAARIHAALPHEVDPHESIQLALHEISTESGVWRASDRRVADRASGTLANLPRRIESALAQYAKRAPQLMAGWLPEAVEYTLPSGSRLDLAALTPEGSTIADLKCKVAPPANRWRLLSEYRVSHQLRHYLWEYSTLVNRPIDHYYIILCTVDPFNLELIRFACPDEDLQQWLASSRQIWQDIHETREGRRLPFMKRDACVRPWGRCEMWDACHEFKWDEGLMESGGYTR